VFAQHAYPVSAHYPLLAIFLAASLGVFAGDGSDSDTVFVSGTLAAAQCICTEPGRDIYESDSASYIS
jgi:hypothetical protein